MNMSFSKDNMSVLSLKKNGRILSSKRTEHIKAKFFLIKDYYKAGEIDLRYCPTDVMWADVLTKPLQGQKFRDMRVFLQNCSRSYDDDIELQTDKLAQKLLKQQVKTVASLRECVEEHMKNVREKGGQNKNLCCVLWANDTRPVFHEKTRQGSTLHLLGRCRHCSKNYETRGASGGKYEARIVIFCILAAIDRFSRISWKAESR
jgi:hypothetical protein